MSLMCSWFGFSRQAWYAAIKQMEKNLFEFDLVIVEIKRIRKRIPGIGSGKLYELIKPFFFSHQLKIGRDKLHQLMKKEGLLVKRKHYKVVTTQSDHSYKKYPNLIKDFIPTGTEQLWVSDMTYIQVGKGFVYLSLIMDAFSRKIVGWALQPTLEAKGPVAALKMALKTRKKKTELIHHSDRGVQYCSWAYVDLIQAVGIKMSMCSSAEPNENSMAERLNRTLKEDFKLENGFVSEEAALKAIPEVIETYNNYRPHASLDYKTPTQCHHSGQVEKLRWYPYKKIRFSNVVKKQTEKAQ
jgi:putative transposase